jgi:hypothetical protein
LNIFETKAGAAGLCNQDMNRFHMKPTVNPAFKLYQPLPSLNLALEGKSHKRPDVQVAGLDGKPTPAINELRCDNSNSPCKNFAFNNLF